MRASPRLKRMGANVVGACAVAFYWAVLAAVVYLWSTQSP